MRIVRMKLSKKVKEYLKIISTEFHLPDVGFAEDVYALLRLKGDGLPTSERIKKMAKDTAVRLKTKEIFITLLISKRKIILKKLSAIPYFVALATIYPPLDATRRLMLRFRELYFKLRQSQCTTCHLMSQCDFGKQYGEVMTDITKVLDPDFSKKVHQDCPLMPEIDFTQQLAAAATMLKNMSQPAEKPEQKIADKLSAEPVLNEMEKEEAKFEQLGESAEDNNTEDTNSDDPEDHYQPGLNIGGGQGKKSGFYDGSHDGSHICKITESFIDKVTQSQLSLFELGRKLGIGLASKKKGKFAPVTIVEKEKKQQTIEQVSEVNKVVPTQHALPEKVFEQKLLRKQLVKTQNMQPSSKQQLLYLLHDNSASMGEQLGGNRNSLITKGALSNVLCLAVCRRVRDDGGIVFLRFFSGGFSNLYMAKKKEDYLDLLLIIASCSYVAGGTDIRAAVEKAQEDITTQGGDIASAEILLCTDCEDSFSASDVKQKLGKVPLNILDVSGGGKKGQMSDALKTIATQYYKANEQAVDVNKLVELV